MPATYKQVIRKPHSKFLQLMTAVSMKILDRIVICLRDRLLRTLGLQYKFKDPQNKPWVTFQWTSRKFPSKLDDPLLD